MILFTIKAAKEGFFDRKKVIDAMDKATRKALSKFGAFVRRRAQTSIRKRRAVSEPGSPPSSHVGTLRKAIFFSYDPGRKSVVIGPTLLNGRPARGVSVPSLLEHGGEVPGSIGADGKARLLRYRPRPFMRPAFEAELPNVSAAFWGSIKGG